MLQAVPEMKYEAYRLAKLAQEQNWKLHRKSKAELNVALTNTRGNSGRERRRRGFQEWLAVGSPAYWASKLLEELVADLRPAC